MSALALPSLDHTRTPDQAPVGVSSTSDVVIKQWRMARHHFTRPVTRATISQRFADLAETWREERGFSSSLSELVLNPAYQQIIALGPPVVPSILVELAIKPDHWFWALTMITGVNPIPETAQENVRSMARYWIQWGEEQGLID